MIFIILGIFPVMLTLETSLCNNSILTRVHFSLVMDERSSSDDGNSLADDDKGQGPRDMVEFDDQNNKHADEISPIESDSDDLDGESLEGSNKFSSHSSESEDTTHSYSNSLLEDDGDDKNDNDDDSDEYYGVIQLQSDIQQFHTPDLSDFSNGKCVYFIIIKHVYF